MRKPNGYGTVYKLSGKRRKPWVAAITKNFHLELDGVTVKASEVKPEDIHRVKEKRERYVIGYYPKRMDAELALSRYRCDPYETGWTFKDVYERWIETKNVSDSRMKAYGKAYRRFEPLYDRMFSKLKVSDLEAVMDDEEIPKSGKVKMKSVLNQMYAYALKHDIVQHDLASRFSVEVPEAEIERKVFTDEEIKALWESDREEARFVLIMLYTGVRISELLTMEIDRDEWLMKYGLKTEAGRTRIVPIREKIRPLMDYSQDRNSEQFYHRMYLFCVELGHTTHDCRVTFTTKYKNADETALKLILGHKITDVTKGVYTKYTIDELRAVIDSVDY